MAFSRIPSEAQNGFLVEIASFKYPCVASIEFVVLGIHVETRFHIEMAFQRCSLTMRIVPSAYVRPTLLRI
jgi:hypothetical protein